MLGGIVESLDNLKISSPSINEDPSLLQPLPIPSIPSDIAQLTNLPKLPVFKTLKINRNVNNINSKSNPERMNPANAFSIKILNAKCLTTASALKRTLAVTLERPIGSNKSGDELNNEWEIFPGDSFGVSAPNPEYAVNGFCERLGVDPMEIVSFECESSDDVGFLKSLGHNNHVSWYELFQNYFGIVDPVPIKKNFIRYLSDYAQDAAEKKTLLYLCSRQGTKDFSQFLTTYNPTVLDLLLTFGSVRPPLESFLQLIPAKEIRYYSVAHLTEKTVSFVFNVVDYKMEWKKDNSDKVVQKRKLGVCTSWLDTLTGNIPAAESTLSPTIVDLGDEDIRISVVPRITALQNFRYNGLDKDGQVKNVPRIFIGPGTGVAPFMSFPFASAEQEDEDDLKEQWLIFGCRDAERDWLFRSEMSGLVASKGKKVFVALSRQEEVSVGEEEDKREDGTNLHLHYKSYFTDVLERESESVYRILSEQDGEMWFCGDARMHKCLQEWLVSTVSKHDDCDKAKAAMTVASWSTSGKLRRDVW